MVPVFPRPRYLDKGVLDDVLCHCAHIFTFHPFLSRPLPPDISKVQDDEVGDGTTSVVVLAGELLREAEQLVNQKIHPMTIIAGFREACECAREVLAASAFSNAGDAELFRRDLMNIAKTTLSSKILTGDKEHFANLAVDAIMRLKGA